MDFEHDGMNILSTVIRTEIGTRGGTYIMANSTTCSLTWMDENPTGSGVSEAA